jgi:uncharacterized membrane protein YkoI
MANGMTNIAWRLMIKTMKKRPLLAWITAFLLPVGNMAFASDDHESARRLSEAHKILPLETILEHARQHQPGRVLEVEFEEDRERYIYEIEILNAKGIVWELKLDAQTGQLLERKQEN